MRNKSPVTLAQHALTHIDALIDRQLNLIMHKNCFQQLEASWRGLHYLVEQLPERQEYLVKIKVLSLRWSEVSKDVLRAVEFDQSQLFAKIYNNEFGQPGGEPFGLLIGDYYISHRTHNDITTLQAIAKIAAAAFSPFVTSAKPNLFGLDDFKALSRPLDWNNTFQQAEYLQWKSLRNDEDARFVGITVPQVLMRVPYTKQHAIYHPLLFSENSTNHINYVWGNAAYCLAAITMRAFQESGWFANIRGKFNDNNLGGTIPPLSRHQFSTDKSDFDVKHITNTYITSHLEKHLSDLGFIPLCENQYLNSATFYACPSLQKPKTYDRENANQNAKLSSMLHYILCVSRFAHYLKVIARDKVGSLATAEECESFLQEWLHNYTADGSDLSEALKAKYPLRDAKVEVNEAIGNPGKFLCAIHLCPHYQFDQLESYLHLKTEIIRSR